MINCDIDKAYNISKKYYNHFTSAKIIKIKVFITVI